MIKFATETDIGKKLEEAYLLALLEDTVEEDISLLVIGKFELHTC